MNQIRRLRTERGIKQVTLAAELNVGQNTISNWENGKTEPDQKALKLMAEIFETTIDEILGRSSKPEKIGYIRIPVLGRVAAGIPIDAIEEIIDWEDIPAEMTRGGVEYFGLQIKGDSMEPKISDGDIVIVRKQPDVESGEIAIVLVNGDDATVKKVKKSAAGMTLIANNPAYDPLFYSNEDIEKLPVAIIGRVVELRAKI
nr:MAG TPA: Repressor protein CI [Caudoviricetes sp.]